MTSIRLIAAVLLAASLAHARPAHADDVQLGTITVSQPYARATSAGQSMGGGFLKLDNRGADDRLLSASAAVAGGVELHTMTMEGDVMRMRAVDAIALPAGKAVEFKPGGMHIMFVGLKAPLKAGDRFPLNLRFEKAGEVTVMVDVQPAGASAAAPAHDHAHKH